jgi:hypothetical protein
MTSVVVVSALLTTMTRSLTGRAWESSTVETDFASAGFASGNKTCPPGAGTDRTLSE